MPKATLQVQAKADESVSLLVRDRSTGRDAKTIVLAPGQEVDLEVTDTHDVVVMSSAPNGHVAASGIIGVPRTIGSQAASVEENDSAAGTGGKTKTADVDADKTDKS